MLVCLLISTVLILFAYLVCNYYVILKQTEKIPGPKPYFLIGNALELFVDPAGLFSLARKLAQSFPGIYKFIVLNLMIINIYNPQDLEIIISSSKHHEKGWVYHYLQPWLGDGLLLSKGKKWQVRRKILTPTFHFNILNQFCVVLEKLTKRLVDKIQEEVKQPVQLQPILSQFTLAVICETSMGTDFKEDDPSWKQYKNAITVLGTVVFKRFCNYHLYFDSIYRFTPLWRKQQRALKDLHGFTGEVIKTRKEYLKNKKDVAVTNIRRNKHTPMLDLLIAAEDEGLIDSAGIQEEVDTFMFEGHDTTSSGLTFCLMALANNEHIQDKIYKELQEIFGDSNRSANMEDLSNMKYLECCIKESLRLYPPVHFINRIINEDVILSDHKISAGTVCNIHIYDLHRREDLFPNPESFDPDRFLPENCVGRHPYAYMPFSAGPRNCIGQRFAMLLMKSALNGILRRYKLLPVTRPADIQLLADLVLRNSGPVEVIFTERQ